MSKKSFDVTTLDNGLRVATDYLPEAKSASASWVLRAGSNYDRLGGEAHFFEHLLCSGHEGNPDFDLTLYTDNWGAETNFFTNLEYTYAYMDTLPRRIPEYIDLLGKMICHSLLADSEIERQRGIIRQEKLQEMSNPDRRYLFNALQSLYGQAPFTRNVLGSLDAIMDMKKEDLTFYRDRHYLAGDMALIVSGPIPHDHVVLLANQAFSKLKTGKNPTLPKPGFIAQGPVNFHEDRSSQKIEIVYPISHDADSRSQYNSLRRYLRAAISEHMRDTGIAYSTEISLTEFSQACILKIEYETDSATACQSIREVERFLSSAEQYITPEKYEGLTEVDEYYEALDGERPRHRMESIDREYKLTGRILSYKELTHQFRLAGPEEARQALRNLLSLKPRILGMGPVDDLPDFSGPAHSLKNQFEPRNT